MISDLNGNETVKLIEWIDKVLLKLYLKLRLDVLLGRRKHKFLKYLISICPYLYPHINRWFWGRIGGEEYHEKMMRSKQHLLTQWILAKILKGCSFSNFLEVGCGTGDNLVYLKKLFPDTDYVGCDFSPKQIGVARTNKDIQFDIADAGNMPYKNREFDVVLTVGCLAHIPPKYIVKCAKEIQRVARRYLFVFEEDLRFTRPLAGELFKRSGWHFYHDYDKLFDQFELKYSGDNTRNYQMGLHTHLYERKGSEFKCKVLRRECAI